MRDEEHHSKYRFRDQLCRGVQTCSTSMIPLAGAPISFMPRRAFSLFARRERISSASRTFFWIEPAGDSVRLEMTVGHAVRFNEFTTFSSQAPKLTYG